MKIYNYIFFKLYKLLSEFDDQPSFWVIIVLCWLFLFNCVTLTDYILADTVISSLFSKQIALAQTIVILIGHFLYFNRNRRTKIIDSQFKGESRLGSVLGFTLVVLYFILTILVFFQFTVPAIGR